MSPVRRRLAALAALSLMLAAGTVGALDLSIVDAIDGRPLPDATVVIDGRARRTDDAGRLRIATVAIDSVRAPGYRRHGPAGCDCRALTIGLQPVRPKALYLSAWGIGSAALRDAALARIAAGGLDALVIDAKGDRGIVPWRSPALIAAGFAAQSPVTVPDMPALMQALHARGLYLIARVVVFKDAPLAMLRPDWAVRDAQGAVWLDREGLGWIDPFRREAWARTLALAEEAAALGFDEIQFDYLRFPDSTGLRFHGPDTEAARVDAIEGFLLAARERLEKYNVFISADIFGYVAWNADDTGIGQKIESIAGKVDYLSPMLYPSGFTFGIPGHRKPVAAVAEIVDHTLAIAIRRSGRSGLAFRPWLQAFRDYAFDHRAFGPVEVRAQIDAAEANGTHGWMLWNPHNRYEGIGLGDTPPAR